MTAHVVLGMHRSGTSLVTRLLELAGCDLGPPEDRGASGEANPTGFHENYQVLHLNDAVLGAEGASWFNVLPVAASGFESVDREEFDWRASQALRWAPEDGPWAMKDPRMTLTFELWRAFLQTPHVLLPVRHPVEVAHSLHVRDGMSLEIAAALWEYYVIASLEKTRGLRRQLVLHRELFADPAGVLRSIVDRCDELRMPAEESVLAAFDADLHRNRVGELPEPTFLSSAQHNLYEAISSVSDADHLPTLAVSAGALEVLEAHRHSTRVVPMRPTRPGAPERRTAVVVQGCLLPVFEPSLRTIRETWASESHPGVDVFFAYGNGCADHDLSPLETRAGLPAPRVPDGEVVEDGDLLLIGCSDLIHHQSDALLRKRLLSLAHLLETDSHDAFLLVCASSYVDQKTLAEHVATLDLNMRYQGPAFVAENGRALVSGSAMLLSRDLAQRLVADSAQLLSESDYRYADDVSIGDWIASEISDATPAEIAERLLAGEAPTTDNTFQPPPVHLLNYLELEPERHVLVDGAYHYHFATDEPTAMRRFHERCFVEDDPTPDGERTIFVQIASYRDRDLPRTVESAISRAAFPERLRFGICWQYDEKTFDDLEPWRDDDRVRVDEVYYRKSEGCTWARSRANELFDGEDYYLQIDAHMRFAAGWDETLIAMLESIDAPRPILTVYPPSFHVDDEGDDVLSELREHHVLALASINEHLQTRQTTRVAPDQESPGKSPLVAAGFLFARGSFCSDVPYDPFGYFVGEEIALAARAFSWGYDFFHPTEQVVWHRYDHEEPLHWDDRPDVMEMAEDRSRERLASLLLGSGDELAEFGLGPYRSLEAFEEYCGIDFGAVARGDHLGEPTTLEISIDLDIEGLDTDDDYEVWVLAILAADGRELLRADVSDDRVMRGETTRVDVAGEFTVRPTQYLLWPKSRANGFGERRIRDLAVEATVGAR